MAPFIYSLCALGALGCAALLLLGYRRSGMRLLLWSAICFACLTINNALIAVDLLVIPETDIFVLRNLSGLVGVVCMLYGLIWEAR